MGVFGGIFGKKPKKVQLRLEDSEGFLEKELSGKRKELLSGAGKKLAEIKHVLKETKSALGDLENAEAVSKTGRIDKIVSTAKGTALKQIGSLLDKLSPPNTLDIEEIRAYSNEAVFALQQAGHFGKNVAYAGISFRDEMKAVGENMKELSQEFASLQKLLKENRPVFLLQAFKKRLSEQRALENEASLQEKEIESLEKAAEANALEKSRLLSSLKKLREGPDFKAISRLNEHKAALFREKQKAKTGLLDLFAKIEKPLHRLDKAAKAGKFFLPKGLSEFLAELSVNPFVALKRDPKAEKIKAVLLETKKAINSGAVDLKEKEKEKKLAVLEEMLSFDFFTESFWKFNKIDSEILGVEKALKELPALSQEASLLGSLKALDEKQEKLESELEARKSQRSACLKKAQEAKVSLQNIASEALGKEVSFKE
jgi:hypothetical protein